MRQSVVPERADVDIDKLFSVHAQVDFPRLTLDQVFEQKG